MVEKMITINFTVEEIKELYDSLESVEDDIQQEMLENLGTTLLKSTYALLDGIRKIKEERELIIFMKEDIKNEKIQNNN